MTEILNEKLTLSPGAAKILTKLESFGVSKPSFHVVLGSGFKDALAEGIPKEFTVKGEISFGEVPGLHPSTAPGHAGKYVVIENNASKKVGMIQVGRLHGYEGLDPRVVVSTVMCTRELGCALYFITNAAGGLDPAHKPGDVMMITDHINFTGKNPLYGTNPKGPNGKEWGPRFPDLTKLYDRKWQEVLTKNFAQEKLKVHEGVYLGVLGPAFETPAEIRFFMKIGTHSVGMSTVWETMALSHSGATVSAMSLISNIAAGLLIGADGHAEELDHFNILDACKNSSIGILSGILKGVLTHG
jgi:purine-nucleoside phosphorylase